MARPGLIPTEERDWNDLLARVERLEKVSTKTNEEILLSDGGSSIGGASNGAFAVWPGISLTIVDDGLYEVSTGGPVFVQATTAAGTEMRLRVYKNSVAVGREGMAATHAQFDGSSITLRDILELAAGDVLDLRYRTNGQPANFGGLGVALLALRIN